MEKQNIYTGQKIINLEAVYYNIEKAEDSDEEDKKVTLFDTLQNKISNNGSRCRVIEADLKH